MSKSKIMIINCIETKGLDAIVLAVHGLETVDGGVDLDAALREAVHPGEIVRLSDLAKEIIGQIPEDAGIWVLSVGSPSSSDLLVVAGSRRAEIQEAIAVAQGRSPWGEGEP